MTFAPSAHCLTCGKRTWSRDGVCRVCTAACALRRPCLVCGTITQSVRQLCPSCRPPHLAKRPCRGCGVQTESATMFCRRCREMAELTKMLRVEETGPTEVLYTITVEHRDYEVVWDGRAR
jgi:hypothetical protein